MWSALNAYWWRLSEREQRLLLVMSALLIGLLFWQVIWKPVMQAHQAAERRLAHAQTQWHWLNAQIAQHPQLLVRTQTLTPAQLKAWLQGVLQQQRLQGSLTETPKGLRLTLRTSPAQLVQLLNKLQRADIQVVQLQLTKSDDAVVQVTLILKGRV